MKRAIFAIILIFALAAPAIAAGPAMYGSSGNMKTSVYDKDKDGIVDAEAIPEDLSTHDMKFKSVNITGTLRGGLFIVSSATDIVLTSADWNKVILMTAPGEVQLPDAGASDIGKYIIVIVRDAGEQVEVALTDATELFVTTTGTALAAGNEADMDLSALSKTTFVYMETGKWYAFGSPIADGGVAD